MAPHTKESVTAYQLTTNPEELVFQFNDTFDGTKSIRVGGYASVHPVDANIRESLTALLNYPVNYVTCEELSVTSRIFNSEEHVYLSKERRLEFLDKKWSDYLGTELHVVVGFVEPIGKQQHECNCGCCEQCKPFKSYDMCVNCGRDPLIGPRDPRVDA